MSTWADVKAAARKTVHAVFQHEVLYTPPGGAEPVPLTVRLHENTEIYGDLDREGYARVAETINRIVFMSDQSPLPLKGGLVTFVNGDSYAVKSVWPQEGPLEIPCEVVKQ